jgi:hypothetical protein
MPTYRAPYNSWIHHRINFELSKLDAELVYHGREGLEINLMSLCAIACDAFTKITSELDIHTEPWN